MTTTPDDGYEDLAVEVGRLRGGIAELTTVAAASNATTLEAMRRRTRLEWIVLGVCAVVIVGMILLGWATWQVRSAQDDTKRSARATRDAVAAIRSAQADSRETLRTIKDCTDPAGKCAQRGQAQTGKAVATIRDGQVIAAWCALHSPTLPAARACVAAHSP